MRRPCWSLRVRWPLWLTVCALPLALLPFLLRTRTWWPDEFVFDSGAGLSPTDPQSITVRPGEIDLCCEASDVGLGNSAGWVDSPQRVKSWDGKSYRVRLARFSTRRVHGIVDPAGHGFLTSPGLAESHTEAPEVLYWDLEKQQYAWGFPSKTFHGGPDRFLTWQPFVSSSVHQMAYSPSGETIVFAKTLFSLGLDGASRTSITTLDARNGHRLVSREISEGTSDNCLWALFYSPGGRTIVTAHANGLIVVLNAKTLRTVSNWQAPIDARSQLVDDALISPDGKYLLLSLYLRSSSGHRFALIDLVTHRCLATVPSLNGGVGETTFDPTGKLLAIPQDTQYFHTQSSRADAGKTAPRPLRRCRLDSQRPHLGDLR